MSEKLQATPPRKPRAPRPLVCGALALLVFCMLQLNGRSIVSNDSLPYRYLPDALLDGGTFRLDAYPWLAAPGNYSIVHDKSGHLISKKPVLPGLAVVPLHLVYRATMGQAPQKETHRMLLGKMAASALAGLAAAVTALLVGAAGSRRRWLAPAAGVGMVFLTPFWFTAMDCWPHPLLALLHGAALWVLLTRRERTGGGGWGWCAIGVLEGLAIAARLGAAAVTLAFLAAAMAGTVAESGQKAPWRARARRLGWLAAGLAAPLALLGWYNAHYFGNPWSQGFGAQAAGRLQWPLAGVAGLLFSPAKGLFVFSPVMLLALAAAGGWRRFAVRFCAGAIMVHLLFWGSYADWMGGWCYGPRYLADVAPLGALLAAVGLERILDGVAAGAEGPGRRARWARGGVALLVAALVAVSLAVQVVGMFGWDAEYDRVYDRGFSRDQQGWVWQAPPEPAWILQRGVWYWPRHIP